jgi:transcriptional antiterminator Rof (Rho-off)
MLVIELKDGTKVEVPGARRVRRNAGELICVDERGETLSVLAADQVTSFAIAPDPKVQRRRIKSRPEPKVANG